MQPFTKKVRSVVAKIPVGKTMTYKQVAAKAGNPRAARAVGAVMRANYDPAIPCHRVIRSEAYLPAGRALGGYNRGGPAEKRRKLVAECVIVV